MSRPAQLLRYLCICLAVLAPGAALAHPHVFVTATEQVLFGADGSVTGIRAAWTFDDMYSSFLVQGLGEPDAIVPDDKLADLAKTNVESLDEFGYFTFAKAGGQTLAWGTPTDYRLHESADKLLTLTFTLPLKTPASARQAFSFSVYDPTYFVAFDFAKDNPVSMAGAPAGCSTTVVKPPPLDASETKKLSEAFFTNMSPGLDFGIKVASRVVVACP